MKLETIVFLSLTFVGKSLICKEKAAQESEKEEQSPNSRPVYFISLVGVDKLGEISRFEHIYDVYTKLYDFVSTDVIVLSAQDLWRIYQERKQHEQPTGILKRIVKSMSCGTKHNETFYLEDDEIYSVVESFIKNNANGHFIIDECPFILDGK